MTHIENVGHIHAHGITHRLSPNCNSAYVPIGDNSIITTRAIRKLPNGRILGNFIPFYFWGRMPMLYVIQNGHNGVTATKAADIVYCITSVAAVIKHNLPFCFTDGHAIDGFSQCYNADAVETIETLLDFKAIKATYWKDDKDLDLKRRKEAEFLIAADVPITAITGYIVYNQAAKDRLLGMGVEEQKIHIRPVYYF